MRLYICENDVENSVKAFKCELGPVDVVPGIGDLIDDGDRMFLVHTRAFSFDAKSGNAVTLFVVAGDPAEMVVK